MGWLRLLLATCVVAFHTGGLERPFFMLSGTHAVEAFFLISGYFMAAVLDTKYRGQLSHDSRGQFALADLV